MIFIDADGCPVTKLAVQIAIQYEQEITIVTDINHHFDLPYAQLITVDQGRDAADFAILNRLNAKDIVITQDYGLASLVLAKQAFAINENGEQYNPLTIDVLLASRQIHAQMRQAGVRTKGPKKRKTSQNNAFEKSFRQLIEQLLRNEL